MKVFLASLIPLIACLLLLSEVKCRRRVREDDEYEVSHIRKRAMKFKEYFGKYNVLLTCSICAKEYDIDGMNCINSKQKAKLKCMIKVAKNRADFRSKWAEITTVNSEQPTNLDDFYSPKYLRKTCLICGDVGFLSETNCLEKKDVEMRYCKSSMDELRDIFQKMWNVTSLTPTEMQEVYLRRKNPSKIRHYSKRSITWKNYFRGNDLQKICSICQKYFGIDEASCIKNTPKETHDCQEKVEQSQEFLQSDGPKWNSPEAGQPSNVVDFSENGKNLGQMCSVCDHLFYFSSSDCVVRKEGIRQKCQNWFNEYWKLMKHMEKQKTAVPGSSESASLKFQMQKIKI